MIAAACLATAPASHRAPAGPPRHGRCCATPTGRPPPRVRAAAVAPRALQDFLGDGVAAAGGRRGPADAARGFAAGNGYHTGRMVDRFI